MANDWKKIFESFDFKLSDYPKLIEKIKKEISEKCIILLDGPLGAGKTTFVQEFSKSYGINMISSPTYSIHQQYSNQDVSIDHLDLYRLESAEDIESSGLWDNFDKEQGLVIVEWSSKIDLEDWPIDWKMIKIEILKSGDRRAVLAFIEKT